MDETTAGYYSEHAAEVVARYDGAPSAIDAYLRQAFAAGMRVLDVGAGSGRDLDRLLDIGCDAYGVEPCGELRALALEQWPRLRGRLDAGSLPRLERPFGGDFDGVLCSAVLMHLPRAEVFDAAVAIRALLKDNGRLLISIPNARPGLDATHRDEHGRLFTPLPADYLALLFERLGFDLIGRWRCDDALGRAGLSWHVLLLQIRGASVPRPLAEIEGILSRDRKTATYKLALFRALSEVALTQFEQARWTEDARVRVPVDLVADRWLHYYWPIVASPRFVPQIHGETEHHGAPIAFRAELRQLIDSYRKIGGLTAFVLDYRAGRLSAQVALQATATLGKIRDTIVSGPVRYAGGSLESGRVFEYDRGRREILMSAALWRELSLLGYWIHDAAVLRWAQLTSQISRESVKPSEVIDLLLSAPIPREDVSDARQVYAALARKECLWTGRLLPGSFEVGHIIPFALWRNNELWNLVPALPAVNNKKRDRLPTRELMLRRRDCLVHYWRVLNQEHNTRFGYEAARMLGATRLPPDWEGPAFVAVSEAVEFTAMQRGSERWEP